MAEVNAMTQEMLFRWDSLKSPRPVRTPDEINRKRQVYRQGVENHFQTLMETPLAELLDPNSYPGVLQDFQLGRWADEMGEDFRVMMKEGRRFNQRWHEAYDWEGFQEDYLSSISALRCARYVMQGDDQVDYHLRHVEVRTPTDHETKGYVRLRGLPGAQSAPNRSECEHSEFNAANSKHVSATLAAAEILRKSAQQARADAEAGAATLEVRTRDLAVQSQRIEAATDQLDAKTLALVETISPLNRLYAEVELAEIRKRAIGERVPDLFVDWALMELQRSSPARLPTKGDAFNNCGHGTVIGKKLEQADFGISKQRFADHLTVLRRLLVQKGWLASQGSGKARKRESTYQPDDRLEDHNQPSPAESAEDRDDERQASGLDIEDEGGADAGGDSSKQSDAD
jgi:hypothetical protein